MSDSISRQDAIDALADMHCKSDEDGYVWIIRSDAWARIDALPAAQPEIIRCKECKHSEHWYKGKRRCFLWAEDGIDVFDDGYCNYAEGKEE